MTPIKSRIKMAVLFFTCLLIFVFSVSEAGLKDEHGSTATQGNNSGLSAFNEVQYIRARVKINIDSRQLWAYADGTNSVQDMSKLLFINSYGNEGWVFSDGHLTGIWNNTTTLSGGEIEHKDRVLMLVLNDARDNIIAFNGYDRYEYGYPNTGFRRREMVQALGVDIPLRTRGEEYDLFYLGWQDVCSHLNKLTWKEEWYDGFKKTLTSYSCSSHEDDQFDPSYMEIRLYKGEVDPNRIVVWHIKGDDAELIRAGQEDTPIPLVYGQELSVSDRIYTGMDTKVIIHFFANNSKVTIEELTDIKIAAFLVNTDIVRTRLWLKAGEISASIYRKSTVRSDFFVKTPTATASVRGTRFTTLFDTVSQETRIFDVSGNVVVTQEHNTEENAKALFQNRDIAQRHQTMSDSVMLNPWESVTINESSMSPVMPINLNRIKIEPEYIILNPFQKFLFSAKGISDENESFDIDVEWSAEKGLINDSGLYIAHGETGEFQITIEEPVHNLRSVSTVYIKPDSMTNDSLLLTPHIFTAPDAGQEFWVDIKAGDALNPVNNLFSLNFDLNFTQTEYFDIKTPNSANVLPGDFWGEDPTFSQTVDETSGKISTTISRKAGQASTMSNGSVLRINFVSKENTPQGTQTDLILTDIDAKDEQGNPVLLSALNKTVTVTSTTAIATFDPGPGSYDSPQNVNIYCATPGAVIRYTTTGMEPGENDAIYDSPILLSKTTTIKAKSYKDGFNPGPVVSGKYIFQTTGAGEMNQSLPKVFALFQNYPNPFNPSTTISYDLPKLSHVKIIIYDLMGREIITLVDEKKMAGSYQTEWNGRNHLSSGVASGIYIYKIEADEFQKSKKMLLIR